MTRLVGAALVTCGLVFTAAGIAGAVDATPTGPDGVVVTSYGSYPEPDKSPAAGCPDGNSAYLLGVTYSVVRGAEGLAAGKVDQTGSTLNESLFGRLYPGDKLTVSWQSFAGSEECAADAARIGVSLALKSSAQPFFEQDVPQALLREFAYCGGAEGATSCTEAGNSLTLTMPGYDEVCNYQVDFVIGGPLLIVGPGGSFYGNIRGSGPNMLLSANNGGPGDCTVTTTTQPSTTTTQPSTTTTQPSTTTTQPSTTTTQPSTTTTQPSTTTTQPSTTTTQPSTTTTQGSTTTTQGSTTTTQGSTTTRGTVPTTSPTVPTTPQTTLVTTTGATTTVVTTTLATTVPATQPTSAPDVEVEGTTVTNPETLPVTGNSAWPAARVGILLVMAGAAALAFSRRRSAEA